MRNAETRVGSASSASREDALGDITLRSRLRYYAAVDTATLDVRLGELEREWDLERVLDTTAGAMGLMNLVLSAARRAPSAWLPATLFTILLQYGLQGWSPPTSLLRGFGYRPRKQIEEEIYGLKLLRGDFQGVPSATDATPGVRAYRAWEALKESREIHTPARAAKVSRWRPLRAKRASGGKAESSTPLGPRSYSSDMRAENFVAHVRSKWMPEDDAHLDSALRSVLAHLKWRLSPSDAEPLFAHLPESIAVAAEMEPPRGFAPRHTPERDDASAFYEEVARETGLSRPEAHQATTAIFSSMKRQLPLSQNRALRAMLPKELKRVWMRA